MLPRHELVLSSAFLCVHSTISSNATIRTCSPTLSTFASQPGVNISVGTMMRVCGSEHHRLQVWGSLVIVTIWGTNATDKVATLQQVVSQGLDAVFGMLFNLNRKYLQPWVSYVRSKGMCNQHLFLYREKPFQMLRRRCEVILISELWPEKFSIKRSSRFRIRPDGWQRRAEPRMTG